MLSYLRVIWVQMRVMWGEVRFMWSNLRIRGTSHMGVNVGVVEVI